MTVGNVIKDVSRDLNDQVPGYEYTRWPIEQLQSYLREAFISISEVLKDLFTKQFLVKLEAGANWQKACDCTDIVRIVGEATASGSIIRYLSRANDTERNIWAGPVHRCVGHPRDYKMTGYMISEVSEGMFKVFPPMPPGLTKYVMIECADVLEEINLNTSVPKDAEPIVKQWMIYRALSVDSENNTTITALADAHKNTYFALLNARIEYQEKERNRHGNNLRTVQNTTA